MLERLSDISKLVRLQILLTVLFIFFKAIRPSVLNSKAPEWFKITLLSLPNFFEAFIGTLILTGIGLYLNVKLLSKQKQINRKIIYLLAPILGGVYVITQELKIHNLGGNNVYDVNDLIFSVIGLVIGYLFVIFMDPKIR